MPDDRSCTGASVRIIENVHLAVDQGRPITLGPLNEAWRAAREVMHDFRL